MLEVQERTLGEVKATCKVGMRLARESRLGEPKYINAIGHVR